MEGKPFSSTTSIQSLIIKPNSLLTEKIFQDDFDEVEDFILNRNSQPKYTSTFQYPYYDSNGDFTLKIESVTWFLDGTWNLDIVSSNFDNYLDKLSNISSNLIV